MLAYANIVKNQVIANEKLYYQLDMAETTVHAKKPSLNHYACISCPRLLSLLVEHVYFVCKLHLSHKGCLFSNFSNLERLVKFATMQTPVAAKLVRRSSMNRATGAAMQQTMPTSTCEL